MIFEKQNTVIPDARSAIRNPGDRRARRLSPLGSGFGLRPPRNDGALFCIVALSTLALAACSTVQPGVTPPDRLPTHGAIAYTCANGTQLMVDYAAREARVAIIGGPSLVLPQTGDGSYSNGRYAIAGSNAQAQWSVGGGAPVSCRGN